MQPNRSTELVTLTVSYKTVSSGKAPPFSFNSQPHYMPANVTPQIRTWTTCTCEQQLSPPIGFLLVSALNCSLWCVTGSPPTRFCTYYYFLYMTSFIFLFIQLHQSMADPTTMLHYTLCRVQLESSMNNPHENLRAYIQYSLNFVNKLSWK